MIGCSVHVVKRTVSDLYQTANNVKGTEILRAEKLWKAKLTVYPKYQNVMLLQSLRRYEQTEYRTWKLGDTKVFFLSYV